MKRVKLLDCTLRDGGFLNDWQFGHENMLAIFERLVSAGIDIIEVGFLDEKRPLDIERSIMPNTNAVDEIYCHLDKGQSMVVAMIDYGTCSIDKIAPCEESWLDGIRIIFKLDKMQEAIEFCRKVKNLGYKVFSQAVSITSYDDKTFYKLLDLINDLQPYAFSLVDTYGLLHKKELEHYFLIANSYLKADIGLGYHAHNNFQLAYSNCIELLETPIDRMLIVDGSLYGMGKSAGNAPLELLAMYMNEHNNTKFCIEQLLEAIDGTILDLYRQIPWGYSFKFYLSALNNCHPNYVSYLTDKRKLSVKSINEILSNIQADKKLLYDQQYIEQLYIDYQKEECDDSDSYKNLNNDLAGKAILVIGPGNSIITEKKKIDNYINQNKPLIISINFLPKDYEAEYLFISNSKRYIQLSSQLGLVNSNVKTIATSNVTKSKGNFDFTFRYSSLLDENAMIVDNPLIMLIKIFSQIGIKNVGLAGFDGYLKAATSNYVNPNMEYEFTYEKATQINMDVIESLARIERKCGIEFITSTLYE